MRLVVTNKEVDGLSTNPNSNAVLHSNTQRIKLTNACMAGSLKEQPQTVLLWNSFTMIPLSRPCLCLCKALGEAHKISPSPPIFHLDVLLFDGGGRPALQTDAP